MRITYRLTSNPYTSIRLISSLNRTRNKPMPMAHGLLRLFEEGLHSLIKGQGPPNLTRMVVPGFVPSVPFVLRAQSCTPCKILSIFFFQEFCRRSIKISHNKTSRFPFVPLQLRLLRPVWWQSQQGSFQGQGKRSCEILCVGTVADYNCCLCCSGSTVCNSEPGNTEDCNGCAG